MTIQFLQHKGMDGITSNIAKGMPRNMHCNFLINNGKANSSEIEKLGNIVKEKVLKKSGINLEWEIIRIGNEIENELGHE